MLASTESLIAELNRLHAYVTEVLERGQQAGDDKLVLLGVETGRRNVESLFKLGALADLAARLEAGEQELADAIARQQERRVIESDPTGQSQAIARLPASRGGVEGEPTSGGDVAPAGDDGVAGHPENAGGERAV